MSPRGRRRRAKEPFGVTVRVERLDQLHGVLQAVFDWTDSRLHRFTLDDAAWGDGEKYLCPYDVEEGEDDGVPASDVRLDEVVAATGDVLTYLYDYGDDEQYDEDRLIVIGPDRAGNWLDPVAMPADDADRIIHATSTPRRSLRVTLCTSAHHRGIRERWPRRSGAARRRPRRPRGRDSWLSIGMALGVTKQAAQKRFGR